MNYNKTEKKNLWIIHHCAIKYIFSVISFSYYYFGVEFFVSRKRSTKKHFHSKIKHEKLISGNKYLFVFIINNIVNSR